MNTLLTRNAPDIDVNMMLKALMKNELEWYYQPIVDFNTGECVSIEALARWNSKEHGLLSPGHYLGDHPDLSVRNLLFFSMFTSTLKISSYLTRNNINVKMNINVALRELTPAICDRMIELAAKHRVPLSNYVLEIAERSNIEVTQTLLSRIYDLKELGITLALDDYGIQYSTDNRIAQLPFDIIKLDKSILLKVGSPIEEAKLYAKIQSWKKRGYAVVAEGIETQDQWVQMRDLGCASGQGYLITPAMPFDELPRFLRSWKITCLQHTSLRSKLPLRAVKTPE